MYFAFILLFAPLVKGQISDFACNGIRYDFVINDIFNVTQVKGYYEFFTASLDDGKTMLVSKPAEITYNINASLYINIDYYVWSYWPGVSECVYHEINNSICYIFDSGVFYFQCIVNSVLSLVYPPDISFVIGQGSINLKNGTYIGIMNGNGSPQPYQTNTTISYGNWKCNNYHRLPSADTSLPKCTQLISDMKLYNISNNYDIVASLNIIYTLGTQMNVTGHYRSSAGTMCLQINDDLINCGFSDTQIFSMDFSQDAKLVLSMYSDTIFPSTAPLDYLNAYIGKIIHRNGMLLMEEDRPFTRDDFCEDIQAFISPVPDLLVSPSLCCSSFED